MQDLPKIKQELRDALPKKGVTYIIKSLRELLPADAPKLDLLVGIEADFKKLKFDSIEGILSPDEESREGNKIQKRLLELLQSLEAEDFDKNVQRSHLDPEQKVRKGSILYRIPKEMQLNEESRCIVRIAFNEEIILEDLDMDDDTQLRSEMRISDYMKVEIEDPSADGAFAIRTTSESVQLIDQDDFTEWRFYVKPLKPGEHILELKVSIIIHIDGEDRMREKTLDESVVIITEKPATNEEDLPFLKVENEDLVIPCAMGMIAPTSTQKLRTMIPSGPLAMAMVIGFAALLYMITGGGGISDFSSWNGPQAGSGDSEGPVAAVNPPPKEVEERAEPSFDQVLASLSTAAPAEKEAALASMANKMGSTNAALAQWELAAMTNLPEDYLGYLNQPGDLPHRQAAATALASLEEEVWNLARKTPNPILIDRYLRLYPTGKHRNDAVLLLAQKPTWVKPYITSLPPRVQETDPLVMRKRLLTYANEAKPPKIKNTIIRYIDEHFPGENPTSIPQPPVVVPAPTTVPSTKPDIDKPREEPPLPPTKPDINKPREEPPFTPIPFSQPPVVRMPSGTFTMGCLSKDRDGDCNEDEKPPHQVTLKAYSLSKYEVTVGEYLAFVDETGANHPDWLKPGHKFNIYTGSDDHYIRQGYSREALKLPIAGVSYNDALKYCQWLSEKTGKSFRLPTEAEWEYAARGGAVGAEAAFQYSGGNNPADLAWYKSNSGGKVHPVGMKAPNQLGLYDMSGNVWEWCADGYDKYTDANQTNPKGSGVARVRRGGCWNDRPVDLRNAVRINRNPVEGVIGFRVCLVE